MKLRVDRRVGVLLGAVLFLTFVALGASVALPASDPTLGGKAQKRSALEARGMKVFRNEGCWYCHTQYVRDSALDGDLGDPLKPSAYEGSSPTMLGMERVGPDLTHVGSRYGDASTLIAYLRAPAEEGHRTSMPSYRYLGAADLRALAAYLLSLK